MERDDVQREETAGERAGKLILRGMILLAALTWLAAMAFAGSGQRPTPVSPNSQGAQNQGKGNPPGAAGQQQKKPAPNPFAASEDERLAAWAGAWQENVRYSGDTEDQPSGSGKWMARPFYGLFLVINYTGKGPEGGYAAHGVMAYDHEEKIYKLWWFDDSGNIGQYSGSWKDDNTLVFELKKTVGGRAFRERMTYTRISADEIHTRVEQAWGNEPYKFYMAAAAHRVETPEPAAAGEKQQNPPARQRPPQRPPGN
jgi:hypothetical protein